MRSRAGRAAGVRAHSAHCCARWQILRPLRIDFFSAWRSFLALKIRSPARRTFRTLLCIGRNQHTRVPSCSFLTHNTRTNTQKTRPRWASSTHKQKDGNVLALGLFGLSIDDENIRPGNRFRHPAPDQAKTSKVAKCRLSGSARRDYQRYIRQGVPLAVSH